LPNIDVLTTPSQLDSITLSNSIAVVIDVLRATSSITQALFSGSKLIIPAKNKEEAVSLKKRYPEALLCGEIKGKRIPGFHLGNSPGEYTSCVVKNKILVMTTSNGTKAILGAEGRGAKTILLCSFLNLKAVCQILSTNRDFCPNSNLVIICSGNHGEFSLEDFACAGALVQNLLNQGEPWTQMDLAPAAQDALSLYRSYNGDIGKILKDSPHGRYLMSLGFQDDLDRCARLDSLDVVGYVAEDGIRAINQTHLNRDKE